MRLGTILIGADPEVFVKNAEGKNVSAHSFCPGTKDQPVQLTARCSVQLDGTAMEFNIEPTPDAAGFHENIMSALMNMRRYLPAGHTLDISPSVEYDEETWAAIPDSAKELGCNPDWDAYTGKQNPRPDGASTRLRTGAGHIHIGWIDPKKEKIDPLHPEHLKACCILTSHLDRLLLPLESRWDSDTRRRELYGKPGAFRPKPYGMEYRVLSNAWIRYPNVRRWMWSAVYATTRNLNRASAYGHVVPAFPEKLGEPFRG